MSVFDAKAIKEFLGRRDIHKVTTPPSSDSEFAVPHRLGRRPVGVLTLRLTKNAVIGFSDMREPNSDYAYLKCSAGNVEAIVEFV